MNGSVFWGVIIPFMGTSLGACFVFFLKKGLSEKVNRALTGFAAGVMTAASFWSLLAPALEFSQALGRWAFLPSFIGFWIGVYPRSCHPPSAPDEYGTGRPCDKTR